MQHLVALSRCAVIVRHWFEIDLGDCSLEHGARIELRELPPRAHRGSESAAQVIAADRPLWRADVFDRVEGEGQGFSAAHYHPYFNGNEPCPRVWDPALTADPWQWLAGQFASLGAASGHGPWPLDPEDTAELPGLADQIVSLARQFSPDRCESASECFRLTRDARDTVQLMIDSLEQPELLDVAWVSPWMTGSATRPDAGAPRPARGTGAPAPPAPRAPALRPPPGSQAPLNDIDGASMQFLQHRRSIM